MAKYRVVSDRLAWAAGKIIDEAAFDGPIQVVRLVAGGFLELAEDPVEQRRVNQGDAPALTAGAGAPPASSESEKDRDAE